MAQCEKADVRFHFNYWTERDDILAQEPDIVIILICVICHPMGALSHDQLIMGKAQSLLCNDGAHFSFFVLVMRWPRVTHMRQFSMPYD